ncbi:MAG: hypothetical protein IKM97_01545 [Clostridia bacterium]|nr:hypothetical protein [Clostridia bacterium]
MSESKKALILIDSNGQYDKEKKEHHTMKSAMVDVNFYNKLVSEIQSGKYSEIIYNINLPGCTTKEEIEDALQKDPVLSKLNEEYRKKVKVFMGGYNLSKGFDTSFEGIKLENKLAEQDYEFVIGGLYFDWCVETHERNLRYRYPNIKTSTPIVLSRLSHPRARIDSDRFR